MTRAYQLIITLVFISIMTLGAATLSFADNDAATAPDNAAPESAPVSPSVLARQEMTDAINQVSQIINQPVGHVAYDPSYTVGYFSPGWFHAGAIKPDFNTVDVRKTQQFPYDNYDFVRSDLNPDIMFIGHDLEFNPMTKYFYLDRTVPKKRLSEAEMVEINRLYRIIGKDEGILAQKSNPTGAAATTGGMPVKPAIILAFIAIFAVLYGLMRRKKA